MPHGETCVNSTCTCTQSSPYYSGTCSHWARGVCRRKMYLCYYPPTDFIWRNYSDYDILFCSIGTDVPACTGMSSFAHGHGAPHGAVSAAGPCGRRQRPSPQGSAPILVA